MAREETRERQRAWRSIEETFKANQSDRLKVKKPTREVMHAWEGVVYVGLMDGW